jgi:hypothetical protein
MKQRSCFIVFSLLILFIASHENYAFAQQNVLMFYGKGEMTEGPFPGTVIRTLINNDEATIIHSGANGIEITRIKIMPTDSCIQTQNTLCFDGVVTQTKNVVTHKSGDKIGITLDLKNKKETVFFISGIMSDASVTIDLSKIIFRLNDPSTISLTQEGGIAGIQNEMTINTSTWELVQNDDVTKLDIDSINAISNTIKKLKFTNLNEENYPPVEGAADYFSYSLTILQGTLQKTITWTDASENVPRALFMLRNAITGATHVESEESGQIQLAKNFVVSSPTFAFDGIQETLTILDERVLQSFPEKYIITLGFTSLHGGYGNRTDQIMTQL